MGGRSELSSGCGSVGRVLHSVYSEAIYVRGRSGCDTLGVCHAVRTGFSHCTKMFPVKSHNDFWRPLVEKGVV